MLVYRFSVFGIVLRMPGLTKRYFDQIFPLFPAFLRPKGRRTFKAYNGLNNLFNLGYEILAWKVHRALIKAKLEPYLGFLHSTQHGKLSVCCNSPSA